MSTASAGGSCVARSGVGRRRATTDVAKGVRMPPIPDPNVETERSPHGQQPRGLLLTPSSSTRSGRFGRMFRHVPVYEHDPQTLADLAATMVETPTAGEAVDEPIEPEPNAEPDKDENRSRLADGSLRLPAGYTYFGQFVDHDITFDPVSSLTRQNDPDALTDFRTPRFDLDSLYGAGPSDQPYLYKPDGVSLALAPGGIDLQRNGDGRALIGDPRNDENLIVSQLQVAFINFHNAVVTRGRSPKEKSSELLRRA